MLERLIKNDSIADIIFSYSNEGMIISDGFGKIQYANPKALEMFKYEYDELLGKTIEILVPENLRNHHKGNRTNYEQSPSNRFMGAGRHLLGRSKDNSTFPVEISLSPFQFEGQKYILSFIANISKRKEQEDKLNEMVRALDHSSKELHKLNKHLEEKVDERTLELAESIKKLKDSQNATEKALEREKQVNSLKSNFVSTASHEFRTPLGTILTSLSLIKQWDGKPDKQDKHFKRIESSVDYLLRILNDLLAIEKSDVMETSYAKEEIDLVDITNQVINDLKSTSHQKQSISFEHPSKIKLTSNDYLIRNIMSNLIGNAIKYTKEDGIIIVKITENKNGISILIQDNGMGIPIADQPNIFEQFYRSGNTVSTVGTGLGLYIVKKNLELINGSIRFESEEKVGSKFFVNIPKTEL